MDTVGLVRQSRLNAEEVSGGGGWSMAMKGIGVGVLTLVLAFALSCAFVAARAAHAEERPAESAFESRRIPPEEGLGYRIRAGAIHQFDTGLSGGGSVQVTRAFGDLGARYVFSEGTSVGLSVGYAYDDYDFSPGVQIGGQSPWTQVNSLRISAPTFWEVHPDWRLLLIPVLRMSAERVGDWGGAISGGGIAGFSYRVNNRLRIGPGVGVLSEIEDDPTIFPVIVVDWRPTDKLRVETGRGLGATTGPGLLASYEISRLWQLWLGFRYERFRFRLGGEGDSQRGVGEDRSFPIYTGLRFGLPFVHVSVVGGVELGGRLRIQDNEGRTLATRDYDPAPFVGVTVQGFF
jgi:hypothetical protein